MTNFSLTNVPTVPYIDGKTSPDFREYGAKRGKIGVFAIHGGGIEIGTEQIARNIAKRTNCSVYIFSGRKKTGNNNLRISSIEFASLNHPLFSNILSHIEKIVAIHGHNQNKKDIHIGGRNVDLKSKIAEALKKRLPEYHVITFLHEIPDLMKGIDPNNFVNLPQERGMQIELPQALRVAKKTTGWSRHEWSDLYGDTIKVAGTLAEIINSYPGGR